MMMMKLLTLFSVLLLAGLSAKADNFMAGSRIEGKVVSKAETSDTISVTVECAERATMEISIKGYPRPAEFRAFRELEVGKRYTFPQAFRAADAESDTFTTIPWADVKTQAPFRAVVITKAGLDPKSPSLRVIKVDGSKLEMAFKDAEDLERLRTAVRNLVTGETYEFPAALLADKPAADPQVIGAMKRYLGEWRGTMDADQGTFITMSCALTGDGKGMWREIVFDNSDNSPALRDISIVKLDAASGQFITTSVNNPDSPPSASEWNEATQTFTTNKDGPRTTTAKFETPDRIRWDTFSKDASGVIISSLTGTYTRLKKLPPRTTHGGQTVEKTIITAKDYKSESTVPRANAFLDDLWSLRSWGPFRATVKKVEIRDSAMDIELKTFANGSISLVHSDRDDWAAAIRIAERLKAGVEYEFPEALSEGYVSPAPDAKPRPKSEKLAVLEPLIGNWLMIWDEVNPPAPDATKAQGLEQYAWSNDGSGLWHETKVAYPAVAHIRFGGTFLTVHPARQVLVERFSSNTTVGEFDNTWDAATKTLTSVKKIDSAKLKPTDAEAFNANSESSKEVSNPRTGVTTSSSNTQTLNFSMTRPREEWEENLWLKYKETYTTQIESADRLKHTVKVEDAEGKLILTGTGHSIRIKQ